MNNRTNSTHGSRHHRTTKSSALDALSQKIWDKYVQRKQSLETFYNKNALWKHLCAEVKVDTIESKNKWQLFHIFHNLQNIFKGPRYDLFLVGSTVSGFALDTSDVDMCLVSRLSTTMDPRVEAVYHLDTLRNHLNSR